MAFYTRGEVVQLASGSAPMTVAFSSDTGDVCLYRYHEGSDQIQILIIHEDCLTPWDDDDDDDDDDGAPADPGPFDDVIGMPVPFIADEDLESA